MTLKSIAGEKEELVERVAEADKKFIEMTVDAVVDYFEKVKENPEECASDGKVCPEMIAKECAGMPFLNEARFQQVLDVMYREGLLERVIPEGTGIPHYSLR